MEGVSFYKRNQRDYIFAGTDRFDQLQTQTRCIRNTQFKLILNLDTNYCSGGEIVYRNQMATTQVLNNLKDKEQLSPYFKNWFTKTKTRYELYDIKKDPFEVENLIDETEYKEVFLNLKKELDNWISSSDYEAMSEKSMVEKMLGASFNQPELNVPSVKRMSSGLMIESNNPLASVGWRFIGEDKWRIYDDNSRIEPKEAFEVILFQVGYKPLVTKFN